MLKESLSSSLGSISQGSRIEDRIHPPLASATESRLMVVAGWTPARHLTRTFRNR